MKRAKPQAATKLVIQASENVSRKTRKRHSLKLSPSRIICIMDNVLRYYLAPILPAVQQTCTCTNTQVDARTCLVQRVLSYYLINCTFLMLIHEQLHTIFGVGFDIIMRN